MARATVGTLALATLTTGIAMVERFEGVHEAAEAVMGYPVFTHEMPALEDRMRALVLAQMPDFPAQADAGTWRAVRAAALERYGETVEIERGSEVRTAHPVATLAEAVEMARP